MGGRDAALTVSVLLAPGALGIEHVHVVLQPRILLASPCTPSEVIHILNSSGLGCQGIQGTKSSGVGRTPTSETRSLHNPTSSKLICAPHCRSVDGYYVANVTPVSTTTKPTGSIGAQSQNKNISKRRSTKHRHLLREPRLLRTVTVFNTGVVDCFHS